MTSAEPPRDNCTKQSPPMPVEPASTTHWTAHAVTAASIALPPSRSASTAARVAAAWDVAAMPFLATVSDRPGSSKFRITFDFIPTARGAAYAPGDALSAGRDSGCFFLAVPSYNLDAPSDNPFGPRLSPMSLGTVCHLCVRSGQSACWRRGRDSNPRYTCAYSAFRVRCDRPLCHLSGAGGDALKTRAVGSAGRLA